MKIVRGHLMTEKGTGKVFFEESPKGAWSMQVWKDGEYVAGVDPFRKEESPLKVSILKLTEDYVKANPEVKYFSRVEYPELLEELKKVAKFYAAGVFDENRKPVVTLQGKDLFAGDNYYHVMSNWDIRKGVVNQPDGRTSWFETGPTLFHSLDLAEQYVHANKPVDPAPLVEDLIRSIEGCSTINGVYKIQEYAQKLKTFKK